MEHNIRYLHCKTCLETNQYHQIEVALDPDGLFVICSVHGPITFLTPEGLAESIKNIPPCECCSNKLN